MTSARTRERLIDALRREGIENEAVLERMRHVPRHLFVDEALASRAYENTVLPIGYGQTISQPYIVALMTEALVAEHEESRIELTKVLEIGTGCGYQTAILAPFVQHLYSVERVNPLLKRAAQQLRALRIRNVSLRHSDGWQGWPSQAPFQGILVAAAPERGKANAAVEALLAEALHITRRQVRVVAGHSAAQKLVEIEGLTQADVEARLPVGASFARDS